MNLLIEIDRYMRRTGERPSTIGRKATGDANLIFAMWRGREPRPATIAKLRAYLSREARA